MVAVRFSVWLVSWWLLPLVFSCVNVFADFFVEILSRFARDFNELLVGFFICDFPNSAYLILQR
jgi:lantibiotic modifying enzyme